MLRKKMKLVNTLLVAIPLLTMATASNAADQADFVIGLFNTTTLSQPIHYSILIKNDESIEGTLNAGYSNAKFIKILDSKKASLEKRSAEVILSDLEGHKIWDGYVVFQAEGKRGDFYTQTLALDSHFTVMNHAYPEIHSITFYINSQT